jgi:hypothetical protein
LSDGLMPGQKRTTVVLVDHPTTIPVSGLVLRGHEPMLIQGKDSAVCLVLAGGVPSRESQTAIEKALGGTSITSELRMKSGKRFTHSDISQGWALRGRIESSNEISACSTCACGPWPSVGDEVSEIHLRVSAPLSIKGVYWESTSSLDER